MDMTGNLRMKPALLRALTPLLHPAALALALPLALSPLWATSCSSGLVASNTVRMTIKGGSVTLGSSTTCTDDAGYARAGDHGTHPVTIS